MFLVKLFDAADREIYLDLHKKVKPKEKTFLEGIVDAVVESLIKKENRKQEEKKNL